MREASERAKTEQEQAAKEEMERLRRELEEKHKDQMNAISKDQETNTGELKKILLEKSKQYTQLTEQHQRLSKDCEFYKNRNK